MPPPYDPEPADGDAEREDDEEAVDEDHLLRDAMRVFAEARRERAEVPVPEAEHALAVADEAIENVAADRAAPIDLRNPGWWGCFSFSLKRDTRHGSYEVSCPWHRKNPRTGCKKLFSVRVGTEQGMQAALWKARWWASQAREHELQEDHMFRSNLSDQDMPSYDEIERRRIDERPAKQNILTDVEILARRAANAKAKAKPKPMLAASSSSARPAPEEVAPQAPVRPARAGSGEAVTESSSDSDSSSSS